LQPTCQARLGGLERERPDFVGIQGGLRADRPAAPCPGEAATPLTRQPFSRVPSFLGNAR
jgi:hypothetical protein